MENYHDRMLRRFTVLIVFVFLFSWPVAAQESSLTLPGNFPTLAPLSIPLNGMALPQSSTSTPAPTPPQNRTSGKGFALPRLPLPDFGKVSSATSGLMKQFRLDGALKKLLLDILAYFLSLLKSYWTKADPIIRKFLTESIAKLPNTVRGFMTVFIPFLTMTGKVILGVIGGILIFRVIFFALGKLLSSLFSGKRRRR